MNGKHTPGPWGLERQEYAVVITHQGGSIAATYPEDMMGRKHDALANGHLIAAAPDLLVALQSLASNAERIERDSYSLQGHEHFDPETALEYARAAIAKATGQ